MVYYSYKIVGPTFKDSGKLLIYLKQIWTRYDIFVTGL